MNSYKTLTEALLFAKYVVSCKIFEHILHTGLRPIYVMFFKFLSISFQMDVALTQTRLAKVSNFAEEKTDLSPSVRTCMAI